MAEPENHSQALALFRKGPAILDEALAGVADAESRFSPAPGKWTIRQIARHLTDTEIVAGMRLRQIIAEERPLMMTFDQDSWAANLGYADCDPFDSAAKFRVLREDISKILDELPESKFGKVGLHPERGAKTLLEWVSHFGAHVESHAAEIRRIRGAWSTR